MKIYFMLFSFLSLREKKNKKKHKTLSNNSNPPCSPVGGHGGCIQIVIYKWFFMPINEMKSMKELNNIPYFLGNVFLFLWKKLFQYVYLYLCVHSTRLEERSILSMRISRLMVRFITINKNFWLCSFKFITLESFFHSLIDKNLMIQWFEE